MRPGITVRPERSTVSAPAGTPIVAARPDAGDAVAFDDDAAVLDRRRAAAVDDADVVEDQRARLRGFGGRDPQCDRDAGAGGHPSKRAVHVFLRRRRLYPNSGPRIARSSNAPCVVRRFAALALPCRAARRMRNSGREAVNPRLRSQSVNPACRSNASTTTALPSAARSDALTSARAVVIVGRDHRTDLIEEASGTSETVVDAGVRFDHVRVLRGAVERPLEEDTPVGAEDPIVLRDHGRQIGRA